MLDEHDRIQNEGSLDMEVVVPTPEHDDDPQNVPICTNTPTTARSGSPHEDVRYRYLTFDSEIPMNPAFPPGVETEYPPCPNLRHFDNPFTWSKTRKNWMTWLSCSANITAAYSAGSYASPAFQLTKEWGVSEVAYNVGITIFTCGFGVAPMVLAPFSEINGRRPVFIVTGALFVSKLRLWGRCGNEPDKISPVCQMCCALTDSYGGMLAARFFLGVGGCKSG